MSLDISCRWKDCRPKIESSRTFSSFTHLDNIDVLLAFEDHMAYLEKKITIKSTKKMMEMKKTERKNRKKFKQLLESYASKGLIRPYTLWKDIIVDLEKEESYRNLLGQPGSTPLDFFRDLIVQLNDEIAEEIKEIKNIVKSQDLIISPKTSIHDFQFQLSSIRSGFSKDAQKVVFDQMMDSIMVRIREDKRRDSKKLKKRMDALKSILKRVEPPITMKTPWEEVAARISHKSDYQDLEEEHRIAVFEKYISKIAGKSNRDGSGDESDEKSNKHKKERKRHRRRRSGSVNSRRNSSDEDRHRSSKKKKPETRYEDERYLESRHRRGSSKEYRREREGRGRMDVDYKKSSRSYSEEEEGQVSD